MDTATINSVRLLQRHGQSVWLDYLDRTLLETGELAWLVNHDGITGVTTNPAILARAIRNTPHYWPAILELQRRGAGPAEIGERLAVYDVMRAADLLRPVYEHTQGGDGYVSLEVSPRFARNSQATVSEGIRLWRLLERPNILIKVPGTREGIPAVRELTWRGVNVNVTLLFSVSRYLEAARAYLDGLEARLRDGLAVAPVASVASLFLSRIDARVDAWLDASGRDSHDLRGDAAIAVAGMAYRRFRQLRRTVQWQRLEDAGAQPQRLLWASTGTKDPAYPDTKYVDGLIGPCTVTTLPPATLDAFRDHGTPALSLPRAEARAPAALRALACAGVDIRRLSSELEAEGITKFVQHYQGLLDYLQTASDRSSGPALAEAAR
jgi:transaldolase